MRFRFKWVPTDWLLDDDVADIADWGRDVFCGHIYPSNYQFVPLCCKLTAVRTDSLLRCILISGSGAILPVHHLTKPLP
jgi:hypothetical protein